MLGTVELSEMVDAVLGAVSSIRQIKATRSSFPCGTDKYPPQGTRKLLGDDASSVLGGHGCDSASFINHVLPCTLALASPDNPTPASSPGDARLGLCHEYVSHLQHADEPGEYGSQP